MSAPPRPDPGGPAPASPPPRREMSRECAAHLPDLVGQGDDAAVAHVTELLAKLLKPAAGRHAAPSNVVDLATRRRGRDGG